MAELVLISALVWLPVVVYAIDNRGFVVLVSWLFIAPLASAALMRGNSVSSETAEARRRGSAYLSDQQSVTLKEVMEPTRLLIIAFVAVFMLRSFIKRTSSKSLDRTEVFMCLFTIIVLISVLTQSRRMAYGLRVAADAFIVPFAAYGIARRLVTSEDRLRKIVTVILSMTCYAIVLGLIERASDRDIYHQLRGPFNGPITFYVVMQTAFFVAVLDWLGGANQAGSKRGVPVPIRRVVLYGAPIAVLLTWSRGNWLGFVMGVAAFFALGRRFINPSRKVAIIGAGFVFAAIVAVGIFAPPVESMLKERVTERLDTVNSRLGAWTVIITEGMKSPLLGIGLNNMRDVLAANRIEYGGIASLNTTHNSFLSLFSEVGIVGLLVYLTIAASILHMGLSMNRTGKQMQERWRGAAVVGIMIAYLVPGFFANTLYINSSLAHIYVYVLMGGIAGLHRDRPPIRDVGRHLRSMRLQRLMALSGRLKEARA